LNALSAVKTIKEIGPMTITSVEALQERLSMATEDRSASYVDLVSESNVILDVMKRKGNWKSYSGPTIRERLMYQLHGSYVRYSGFDYLTPVHAELISDAEFVPKQAATVFSLSMEEILANSGSDSQLLDVFATHMEASEMELQNKVTEDIHSDGTADGGKQIGGMQLIIPSDPTTGTYGGINRATVAAWRPNAYDVSSYSWDHTSETAVNAAGVHAMFSQVVRETSKGRKGADLILSSESHFGAFEAALQDKQRITDGGGKGKLGFPSLKFYGGGRSIDVVLEGGIGSYMPDDITYMLDSNSICMRHHPQRNFSKMGGKQRPINQDAIVQQLGFMGEMTMRDPQHLSKLF
jgi:hypothetical protein